MNKIAYKRIRALDCEFRGNYGYVRMNGRKCRMSPVAFRMLTEQLELPITVCLASMHVNHRLIKQVVRHGGKRLEATVFEGTIEGIYTRKEKK